MKEREELELILKLIGDFNLPLSPILDYAIRGKIDEYTEIEGVENNDIHEREPDEGSVKKTEEVTHIAIQGKNIDIDKNVYYKDCRIENKANQCFIINKIGKRIYSSSGKLKILDDILYRILYNNSAISVNLIHWDEIKEKYRLGERIVYERKNSSLYDHLNKANYLEQIKAIKYEQIAGEYWIKVGDRWYSCIGEKSDIGENEIEKLNEDSESRMESLPDFSNNDTECDLEIVDFSQRSIAVIGHTKPHKDSLKAMGGIFMYRTQWGPAWVFSSRKRDRIQAYINGDTSVVNSKEEKSKEKPIVNSRDSKIKEKKRRNTSHFDIRIQYANGRLLCSKNARETLVDVINYAGPERVRQLNIDCLGDNLVSPRLSKNSIYRAAQKEIKGGLYVCICSSIEFIYQQILMINEGCHLGLKVEKVYHDKTVLSKTNRVSTESEPILPDIHTINNNTYSFKGKQQLSKRRFVLEVVKEYVRQHPKIAYESLLRVFPASLNNNRSNGVIKLYSEVMKKCSVNPNCRNYFFLDAKDIVVLKNGVNIVVHCQWGNDFDNFLKVARSLFGAEFFDQPQTTNTQYKPEIKDRKESQQVLRNQGSSQDRRIGYIIRMLPSQQKGEIIGVRVDHEGYKRLVIRTEDYHIKEIDDNPYLYIILKRNTKRE